VPRPAGDRRGPIIEQEVARVGHRATVEDMRRVGRYVERQVLAQAVTWHREDRVIVEGPRTIVFAEETFGTDSPRRGTAGT
jgi:formyltetrahydrofolate hydrolase